MACVSFGAFGRISFLFCVKGISDFDVDTRPALRLAASQNGEVCTDDASIAFLSRSHLELGNNCLTVFVRGQVSPEELPQTASEVWHLEFAFHIYPPVTIDTKDEVGRTSKTGAA